MVAKKARRKNPAAVWLAWLRAKKLTASERRESARKAARARWRKHRSRRRKRR